MIVRSAHQREVDERNPDLGEFMRDRSVMSERSAWVFGYSVFAAVMLMMIGAFHFMAGVVGIIDDDFSVVTGSRLAQ